MNDKEIDRYLFAEMTDAEREQFEDNFADNDELFFTIAKRENDLVDRYAKEKLSGDELTRFEQSLDSNPARRQKVENAKVLHEFIREAKPENKTITIAERSGWFARMFSFGPAVQFASLGVILLLGLASLSLLNENRRLGSLYQDLSAARQREDELVAQIESERESSADLTADLDTERQRIQSLEEQIAKLQTSDDTRPVNKPPVTIATLVLASVRSRDGTTPVRRLELDPRITRVSMIIGVPSDVSVERVGVQLNGESVAENVKTRIRAGDKIVAITVPTSGLKGGRNELALTDASGKVIATYVIAVAGTK